MPTTIAPIRTSPARGAIVTVEHPAIGRERHIGTPIRFDLTPLAPPKPAPCLGADTETVLARVLRPRTRRDRGAPWRRRLPVSIRDRAAIVGIGQHAPSRSTSGAREYDMALEAILAGVRHAGISPREIDGTVRYDMETTDDGEPAWAALGEPRPALVREQRVGGGGSASVIVLAATAIAAGMASTVLVLPLARAGKESVYGRGAYEGGRYWSGSGPSCRASTSGTSRTGSSPPSRRWR